MMSVKMKFVRESQMTIMTYLNNADFYITLILFNITYVSPLFSVIIFCDFHIQLCMFRH